MVSAITIRGKNLIEVTEMHGSVSPPTRQIGRPRGIFCVSDWTAQIRLILLKKIDSSRNVGARV